MGVLDRIYSATRAPLGQGLAAPTQGAAAGSVAPVAPPAAPMPQGQGASLLGTIGGILAPEAGSFWASTLQHGLSGAKTGMRDDALAAQRQQVADALAERQLADKTALPVGAQVMNGSIIAPTPDGGFETKYTAPPVVQVSAQERLLEKWQNLPDGSPLKKLIESMLPNYAYTPEVIAAKSAAKQEEIETNNRTKRFAPKSAGSRAAGPKLIPIETPDWAK